MSQTATHIGFSDESNWNINQFRSLGLVTTTLDYLANLEEEIRRLLLESHVGEFKWHRLASARSRFAALKLLQFAVDRSLKRELRIDVLVWDVEDYRHRLRGRDDEANLQRMYFHLIRNVLGVRWSRKAVWRLHPDPHTAIDWNTINDCLVRASFRDGKKQPPLPSGHPDIPSLMEFGIDKIIPGTINECPLLQLADLFAGLAAFSVEKYHDYKRWDVAQSKNGLLFIDSTLESKEPLSQSSEERFCVLRNFIEQCKDNKMGVSLDDSSGLRTPNPANAINFWRYSPQHRYDRAPIRKRNT